MLALERATIIEKRFTFTFGESQWHRYHILTHEQRTHTAFLEWPVTIIVTMSRRHSYFNFFGKTFLSNREHSLNSIVAFPFDVTATPQVNDACQKTQPLQRRMGEMKGKMDFSLALRRMHNIYTHTYTDNAMPTCWISLEKHSDSIDAPSPVVFSWSLA